MSEDEAIKILRDIPFLEQVENHDVNGPRWILKTNKRLAQARDMVLDLYQREKSNLENLNREYTKRVEEKIKLKERIKTNYISKDKIREKIESIENTFEVCDEEINYRLKIEDKAKIDVLKELLERR